MLETDIEDKRDENNDSDKRFHELAILLLELILIQR